MSEPSRTRWLAKIRGTRGSESEPDGPNAFSSARNEPAAVTTSDLAREYERLDRTLAQQSARVEKQKERLAAYERELSELKAQAARDTNTISRLTTSQARLEALLAANERQRPLLDTVGAKLDRGRIADAVRQSIGRAAVEQDPSTHLYATDVLPRDFYDLLIESMPPAECFRYADPTKQDFEPQTATLVPDLSRLVWRFFEDEVVERILAPAMLEKFAPFVRSHYEVVFGPEFADEATAWPQHSRGRLMLRRPGYALAPHLDPKKVLFTCLIYFARRGDSEEHGTQLYRVDGPFQANSLKTYYPEQHGHRCELARTVPFRANTAFAFINGNAAHAASIPADSNQLERYAYQFYAAPSGHAFAALVGRLPPERQALFEGIKLSQQQKS